MNDIISNKKIEYITLVFLVSVCLVGIFNEFLSCLFSLAIITGLFLCVKKTDSLKIDINLVSVSVFLICALYLITALWAVDAGMAVVGSFKYLPVVLFLVVLQQNGKVKESIFAGLPYLAVAMTVISFVFMQVPALETYFSVAGRLAGFLQYPNTFALLLLISELLLINKEKTSKLDLAVCFVLIAGIILSGSRTVFVLMIAANIVMAVLLSKRKKSFKLLAIIVGIVVIVFTAVAILGGAYITERLLQISADESTFAGRVLYFRDALPVIMQHPFGTGYMGHYYLQQSIQTGIYSVRYIHNDFMQIALDIGLIPCILFIAAIVKSFFSKNIESYKKVILAVICLHACFDFDLQFISVFCLLITFLDFAPGKKVMHLKPVAVKLILTVMIVINLYMGIALTANVMGRTELSHNLYPWNTQNEISRILQISDVNTQEKIADDILERNDYVTLAYSVKARNAYLDGDYSSLILYKHEIFERAPFQYDEYIDYCYKLIEGIDLYSQIADINSINICIEELYAAQEAVAGMESHLSDLGKKIKDQPETELPEDIKQYIEKLGGGDE